MKISVTQDDIQQGRTHHPSACPVALAIKRATGEQEIVVGYAACFFADKGLDLPTSAKTFVLDFDRGLDVKPFDFDILV